jgi:DNA-binding Xre family transcriptional regulator
MVSAYDIKNMELLFPRLMKGASIKEGIEIGHDEVIFILSDGRKILYDRMEYATEIIPKDCLTDEDRLHEFARRFKNVLWGEGMSQKELAEQTGINPMAISRFMRGVSDPRISQLYRICKILKCDPNYLINFDYLLKEFYT